MPAAAVTGLAAEARLARRAGLAALAAGGDPARTRAAAGRLLAEGAGGLVSFGIAGGLDPALASGTLLLPRAVRGERGERWPVDAAWRARLAAALAAAGVPAIEGDVLGATAVVAAPAAKADLFRRTGGVAVDLESHVVAQAAVKAGRPFVVLRAVADPAGRALPPAAAEGLDAAGRPALGRVLRSLAGRPGQLPALLLVARDTRRAMRALLRGADALLGMDAGDRLLDVP